MTATPGSWINTQPSSNSETDMSSTTTQPKKTSLKSTQPKSSSGTSSPAAQKKPDPFCTCGHRNHFHEDNKTCEWRGCDCQRFVKKPFERPEHLTNRPFALNTGMQIMQDRMHVKEFSPKSKKGKRK